MAADAQEHPFGPPKPTLGPGEEPDPEFIERKVLHQLYRLDKWKSTHLSEKDLRSGDLHDVPWREIEEVLDQLAAEDVLIAHSKRPDEEYSLNPARAPYIYEALGIDRTHDPADEDPKAPDLDDDTGRSDEHSEPAYVTEGRFRNTVHNLHERLGTLQMQARTDGVGPELDQRLSSLERRLQQVVGDTSGNDAALTRMKARLDACETRLEHLDGARPEPAHADDGPTEDDPSDPPGFDPVMAALRNGGLAGLLASLHAPDALAQARDLTQRILDATGNVPPAAPLEGLGEPGACLKDDCQDTPTGFAPAFDVHEGPQGPNMVVMLAPACPDHTTNPPIVVRLRTDLNRRTAQDTVRAFKSLRNDLDLPETKRLTSQHVRVIGDDEVKRRWDLAARRVG